jgi:AhpC/TSA antioxidant enzyme
LSSENPQISFVAVSHSDQEATDKWVVLVGGEWNVNVIVDVERKLYARWGLGVSNTWHVLNPWSIYKSYRMAKDEKLWNKPTESGNRWQTAGTFAIDNDGVVRWVHVARSVDDIPDFKEALMALGVEDPKTRPSKG